MLCPPLTRHTAASSSRTRALVLSQHKRVMLKPPDTEIEYTRTLPDTQMHSPGIPAVETEGDLIDTARVSHHLVETGLKTKWEVNRVAAVKCVSSEMEVAKVELYQSTPNSCKVSMYV